MKLAIKLFSVYMAAAATGGCGTFNIFGDDRDDDRHDSQPTSSSPPASVGSSTPPPAGPVTFEGYVQSAFEVQVDGKAYADMETFYTEESANLPNRVAQAGYDRSWDVRFEAAVGLSDLWSDMRVYITAAANTGYQAETSVQGSGKFSVRFPHAAAGHQYRVRANKRISVLLSRGEEQVRICYNFSAIDQSVAFDEAGLPIILDQFQTTLTTYECTVEGGFQIPKTGAAPPPARLAVGRTKGEVATLLGTDGLFAMSTTTWCWAYRTGPKGPCKVDLEAATCDCEVRFDGAGLVEEFDGVADWAVQPVL